MGMAFRPLEDQALFVKVGGTSRSPVEVDGAFRGARFQDMAQDRLEWGESGAPGDHEQGAGPGAVSELAYRALDAQQRTRAERIKKLRRKTASALAKAGMSEVLVGVTAAAVARVSSPSGTAFHMQFLRDLQVAAAVH